MFRKKTGDKDGYDMSDRNKGSAHDLSAPPLKPFSRKGSHAPSMPSSKASGSTAALRHDIPRRGVEPSRRYNRLRASDSESKKLTVGRDICLAGEITSCNKLVVEGQVEAALNDAHTIEITPSGFFKGSAEVDEADISGLYEGELIAREILTVRAGGRINGTVRYGRIVIEAGGEISGDMRALTKEDPMPQSPDAPQSPAAEEPQVSDGTPAGPQAGDGTSEDDRSEDGDDAAKAEA